jgi:hypothetical protein
MAYREGPNGNAGVIDVDYYRLVADPVQVLDEIYAGLGMAMPDAVRRRLAEWIEANPKGKRGAHRYDLADYGLAPDASPAVFDTYRRRFGVGYEAA